MASGILYIILIFFNPILGLNNYYFNQCVPSKNPCNHSIVSNPCCDQNDICTLKSLSNSYTCMKKVQLGMFCKRNEDCDEIRHAKCSTNETCVCRSNNIQLNETICSPLLGEFCWRSELCATTNSLCIDNECQCKSNYVRKSNQCKKMILGSHCESDDVCSEAKFAKCSDNICKCSSNYTQIDSRLCRPLLGGFCETSDDCVPFNAFCIHNICKCGPYFVATSNSKCLPVHFGMACSSNVECTRHIKNSKCSSMNVCTCLKTYYPVNIKSCAPTFNNFCEINEPCANINSMCIDNKCQCKPDYIYRSLQCIPLKLHGSCNINKDCDQIENTVCIDNECTCNKNYMKSYNGTCKPLLGGLCSKNDECMPHHSICVDNVCKCRLDHVQQSNEKCLPLYLKQSCEFTEECCKIKYSVCSHNKCVCKTNYTAWGDSECKAPIGEYCDRDKECLSPDSTCNENKCQCRENFISQLGKYCKPVGLGKTCKTDSNCNMITNATCSRHKICTCHGNHYALSELACAPILGGYCENSNNCFYPNNNHVSFDLFNCIDNECRCNLNSSSISDSQCLDTSLLHSCYEDADCADLLHTECSLDIKKCVCKPNNISLNKLTCFPLIGGYCTADYQCMADHSVCIDNYCQCKPNSVFVAQNSCAYS